MIRLKSILQEAGLLKEQTSIEPIEFNFDSGKYELPAEEQQKIDQVVSQVKELVKQNYKIASITIESSESQVPSRQFKPRELAEKRADAVQKLLAKRLPEYVNQIKVETKIGTTEFHPKLGDKASDDKYKEEQYVRAVIKIDRKKLEIIPFSLIDVLYAIPTARYTRMQGPEGANIGTIKIYSTGRVNTAGTMSKSAADYKMKYSYKNLGDLSSIVSGVARKGTGFEDNKYQKPMDPEIVNKAKELLPVLKAAYDKGAETWIKQNPQQAAELPGVTAPSSVQSNLYVGEVRGFDNLIKFFASLKNKI
jgi:hypothetical protein